MGREIGGDLADARHRNDAPETLTLDYNPWAPGRAIIAVVTVTEPAHCEWCGREIALSPRGRRRKYCDQTCRQRAYEHRKAGAPGESGSGAGAMAGSGEAASARTTGAGMSGARLSALRDGLFELRCAAEDVETAVSEGADTGEVAAMCRELVIKARELEHFS